MHRGLVLTVWLALGVSSTGSSWAQPPAAGDQQPGDDLDRLTTEVITEVRPTLSLSAEVDSGLLARRSIDGDLGRAAPALADCRPDVAPNAPWRVVMSVVIEPTTQRARAWMVEPDKREMTVEQWDAARKVGDCLHKALQEVEWPPTADDLPATVRITLEWSLPTVKPKRSSPKARPAGKMAPDGAAAPR